MPITFLVIYDTSGKILNSQVIKYREPYGGEIANKKWNNQFVGRSEISDYVVGDEVDGISGATISVYSMTKGVMKLSLLFPLIKSQL
jgi:Na+-translocating ferredoxin:NAD+ oxidoreductase RnfG subunit